MFQLTRDYIFKNTNLRKRLNLAKIVQMSAMHFFFEDQMINDAADRK